MDNMTYEEAFKRLEEILSIMNSGQVALDKAVHLYKEADQLTRFCEQKLKEAENTIETLIKDRQGQLVLNEQMEPLTEAFSPQRGSN